ncbi:hypothetical protein NL108_011793 [Boleophthalmus pectinirostris]|nr:hypothetical protein NL108_011793 [Boleophthalmus pectinirostris]
MCFLLPTLLHLLISQSLYLYTLALYFFFFFAFHLSFIVFLIRRPLSERDKTRKSGGETEWEKEVGLTLLSRQLHLLKLLLFTSSVLCMLSVTSKWANFLNPCMRIYGGICHYPQGKESNKQHGTQTQQKYSAKSEYCVTRGRMYFEEHIFCSKRCVTFLANTPPCFMHICKKIGGGPKTMLL